MPMSADGAVGVQNEGDGKERRDSAVGAEDADGKKRRDSAIGASEEGGGRKAGGEDAAAAVQQEGQGDGWTEGQEGVLKEKLEQGEEQDTLGDVSDGEVEVCAAVNEKS